MEALVGSTLVTKDGAKPTVEVLKGKKVVGLYFSASWCGPCHQFTPKLGGFYDEVKATKGFEVVFVSSDKDANSFEAYYAEMAGWTALPFEDRATKAALSKKYKVKGIPTLVLVDAATGELITTDGRSKVSEDPTAAAFPWKLPTLAEILGGVPAFSSKKGADVPVDSLSGSSLLLYFSAHWCPPCRSFTPILSKFFTKLKAAAPEAEIVFVSSDNEQAAFEEYYAEMGPEWLALPYADRATKSALSKHFDVSGIPSLVLVGPVPAGGGDRPVITKSGRACVTDMIIANFPASWAEKPYADLSKTVEAAGSDINETAAVLVLAEAVDDAESGRAVAVLKQVADAYTAKLAPGADPELIFFFATSGDGPVGQVRKLCNAPADGDAPTIIKLDIPDQGGYYVADKGTEVTPETLEAFIASPGERKQLQG